MKKTLGIACLIALIKMELDKLEVDSPPVTKNDGEEIIRGLRLRELILDFLKLDAEGRLPAVEREKIKKGDDALSTNINMLLKAISHKMNAIEAAYPMEVHAIWGDFIRGLEGLRKEIKNFAFTMKAKVKTTGDPVSPPKKSKKHMEPV